MKNFAGYEEEKGTCFWNLRFRLFLCIIIFLSFTALDRWTSSDINEIIYNKLEEPMSEKAVQTWVQETRNSFLYHK